MTWEDIPVHVQRSILGDRWHQETSSGLGWETCVLCQFCCRAAGSLLSKLFHPYESYFPHLENADFILNQNTQCG